MVYGILFRRFSDTPLIIAVHEGYIEIVKLLLKQESIDIGYINI